jgi:hypothetical protein
MLETMDKSSRNILGFKMIGDITKADYETLDPAVEAAVEHYGSVNLLFDLTQFRWEKATAWGSDLDFGHTYKDKIDKMAMVSHARWVKHLAKLAEPFYAREIQTFESVDDAWGWLEE